MSEKKRFCVFCEVKDEEVIPFTLASLNTCNDILRCRQKYQLKFNDVSLPQLANETDCYHRTCHNNFLALKQKYKDVTPSVPSNDGGPSGEQSVNPESSSTTRAATTSCHEGNCVKEVEDRREKVENQEEKTQNEGGKPEHPKDNAENREKKTENPKDETEYRRKNVVAEVENRGDVFTTTLQNDKNAMEMQQGCFGDGPSASAVSDNHEIVVSEEDDACLICNRSRVAVYEELLSSMNSSDKDIFNQLNKAAESTGDEETRRQINAAVLEEYLKRPRLNEPLFSVETLRNCVSNFNCSRIAGFNHLWVLSHVLDIPKTPMWTGFQSQLLAHESSMRKVSHNLKTINASPIERSNVIETIKQALRIADECGQEFMQVTYDFAVAKVALRIQSMKRPQFDRLFIQPGALSIDLAYYKGVGKFIENCGVTNIMIDCGILARGSLSGFIKGNHYNRCERLHTLLSLALQVLHWRQFLISMQSDLSERTSIQRALKEIPSSRFEVDEVLQKPDIQCLLGKYEEFAEDTMSGVHGCTAQYFMTYINLIDCHFVLQASVKRRNHDMYLNILPRITNLLFAFDQPEDARWLTRYHENLLRVSQTHPALEEMMRENGIGAGRTLEPRSTQLIDLILEEAINLDAANSSDGISRMTNSIAARQIWCKNHTFWTHVNGTQDLSMGVEQDVSADLDERRIRKSRDQLEKLVATIDENINPFDSNVPQKSLLNIYSGEAVSQEICDSLLNIDATGNQLREKFIAECRLDERRFERPIKSAKVLTFVDAQPKNKIKLARKVQEVRMQRDLFGRLLDMAIGQRVFRDGVFRYPLTPVPLSFCYADGSAHRSEKGILSKLLESEIESCQPSNIDLVVIDGFFVLHTIKEIPVQYGKIASECLNVFLNHDAREIAVMFDYYSSPSIKEALRRDITEDRQFRITGPEQKRCTDLTKDLKNINFKMALVEFFISEWSKDEYASNLGTKTLYVNAKQCHKFEVVDGQVVSTIFHELSCPEHEEVDSKIVYHVCNANQDSNIVIRCSDTDILIIMLANMEHVKSGTKVWMNAGVSNSLRYVDVTKLYSHLGPDLCKSLPGFHALTGCDSNPSFFRKAKKGPLKILRSSKEYQVALAQLGDAHGDTEDTNFQKIEEFVCKMYSIEENRGVNGARLSIFLRNYRTKNVNGKDMVSGINFDASIIPPCASELRQQVRRARYIANIWCHAFLKIPTALCPTNCGWLGKDRKYTFLWFEGEQVPRYLWDEIIQPEVSTTIYNTVDIENNYSHSESSENLSDDDSVTE